MEAFIRAGGDFSSEPVAFAVGRPSGLRVFHVCGRQLTVQDTAEASSTHQDLMEGGENDVCAASEAAR